MKNIVKITTLVVFGAVPFFALQLWAQQSAQPVKRLMNEVMVGPEDSLDIKVLPDPGDLTKTWRVGTSGDLSLPMIDVIHATGKTPKELEFEIAGLAKKYIQGEPHVTVHLVELRSKPVTISGAVEKPGDYQLAGGKSLFEALLMAGGAKTAGPTVTVRRRAESQSFDIPGVTEYTSDGFNTVDLSLAEVKSGRGEQANLEILPRDIILVSAPPAPRYVYVSGEVLRPGAVELVSRDWVSLLQIVATAGGTTTVASKGKTYIMHINDDGSQGLPVMIDLNKIQKGQAADISLTPGDVVFIPKSTWKTVGQTAMNAAMSTGISSTILVISRI